MTFLWALPPRRNEDEAGRPRKPSVDERRTNEARSLARWLRERLDAGWTVVDRKTGQTRPAHAGDVAFLFRAMTDVWHYETALADLGFDYHTIGGSAFYAQQEVRDVVNVLSVVEDPLDEVALAAALRSPFFSLSDAALFWLARKFEGGLTEGITRAGEIAELSDRDRGLAMRAASLLDALARASRTAFRWPAWSPPFSTSRASRRPWSASFSALRKLANTRKLVRLARDFDRQEGFTLADLVARLRADLDNPPREEQAATTDEESPTIRLMSIHQAKGLEFPIVVIPDLNRNPGPRDRSSACIPTWAWWSGRRARPRSVQRDRRGADPGDSLGWLAFRAIEAEEDRKEALRLFYVAATRARDHLVLSAGLEAEPDAGDPAAAYLSTVGSCCGQNPANPRAYSPAMQLLLERFDWRSGGCLAPLPEGWPPRSVNVVLTTPPEPEAAVAAARGGDFRRSSKRSQARRFANPARGLRPPCSPA